MTCPDCNQEVTEEDMTKYDCEQCHEIHLLAICPKCGRGFECT